MTGPIAAVRGARHDGFGLADLVPSVGPSTFLSEIYGLRCHREPGWAGRFEGLLSWADLNTLLRRRQLDWFDLPTELGLGARALLMRSGSSVSANELHYVAIDGRDVPIRRIDPARVNHRLRRGASLLLRSVEEHHDPVMALADRLEWELSARIDVSVIASFRSTPGLDRHFDPSDGLILQLEGRKHWRVFGPTRPHPLVRDVRVGKPPAGDPVWEGVLEAGDVLYVPRGWWHEVAAMDEPSLHLTLNVYRRTGWHLLQLLRDRLAEADGAGAHVPRFAEDTTRAAFLERLRAEVEAALGELPIDAAFEEWDGRTTSTRPPTSLPQSTARPILPADRLDLELVLAAPRRPAVRPLGDVRTELVSLGQRWVLGAPRAALLGPLLAGRRRRVDEVLSASPELSLPDALTFLEDLVLAGLLLVASPEDPEPW